MFHGAWRLSVALVLVFGAEAALSRPVGGAEPKKPITEPQPFTHVVTARTAYYTTGPQQGRAPDGELPAGVKVQVLREGDNYSQVRTETGVTAYVATNVLKKLEEAGVESTNEVKAIANSNNQFAFDLYKRLREQDSNLFFSPASISTALAMTYAGAAGSTEKQMAQVLRYNLPAEQLHSGYGTLIKILNSRQPGYELTLANRLWANKGYPLQQDFLTLTREKYGSELAQVDFADQTEEARRTINTWVAEQTRGKIEDLIPPGVLDAMTRLVLTNAIYFKGAWAEEFSPNATQEAAFHLSSDRRTTAHLMHQTDSFRYAAIEDLQILELPYAGGDLSMIILLPTQVDGLPQLEDQLTAENLKSWLSRLRKRQVEVFLPKFKLTSQFALSQTLQALGLTLPFSDQADFSGISTAEDLMISEVIHQAYVDVNEEGSEAAAATGVILRPTAAPLPQEPVTFRADHPFVFVIRDNRTDTILFLGRVTNPKD